MPPKAPKPASIKFDSIFADQVLQLDLGDGNMITIKKLTYGEQQKAISESSSVDVETGMIKIDFALLRLKQLHYGIAAWVGPAFEGVELTPGNIDNLSPDLGSFLTEQVKEFNEGIREDEKND